MQREVKDQHALLQRKRCHPRRPESSRLHKKEEGTPDDRHRYSKSRRQGLQLTYQKLPGSCRLLHGKRASLTSRRTHLCHRYGLETAPLAPGPNPKPSAPVQFVWGLRMSMSRSKGNTRQQNVLPLYQGFPNGRPKATFHNGQDGRKLHLLPIQQLRNEDQLLFVGSHHNHPQVTLLKHLRHILRLRAR